MMFWKNEEVLVGVRGPRWHWAHSWCSINAWGGISSADTQAHPLLTLQAQRSPLSALSQSLPQPCWGAGLTHPGQAPARASPRCSSGGSPSPIPSRRRGSWRRPAGWRRRDSRSGCSSSSSSWPRPRKSGGSCSSIQSKLSGRRCWGMLGTQPPRVGPRTGMTFRCEGNPRGKRDWDGAQVAGRGFLLVQATVISHRNKNNNGQK